MKRTLALLLAVVMVLGLAACGQPSAAPQEETAAPAENAAPEADPEAERYGGTFVLSWTPGDTFDPMKTSGWKSYCWAMNVYEGVLARDADGNLAPGVCDYEVSDDGLVLKLWVRDGVTFHDGSPVEIEDVLASIKRAEATVSRYAKSYTPYVESEVIDGDVLTITFSEYSLDTLYYFAANQTWNVVLPKEICEKYGTDNAIIDVADAIGTGPYKLVEGEPGVQMVLERYDAYVPVPEGRTGVASPKKAYVDKIIVKARNDDSVDAMALISGETDFIVRDPALDDLYTTGDVTLDFDLKTSAYYIAFNCDNPARAVYDANVRKAIAAALDYNSLEKVVMGDLGNSIYTPTVGAYESKIYANAEYTGAANIELAKKYLDEAGYQGEEIVLLIGDILQDIGPVAKECLDAAGINIKVEHMDYTAMTEYILNPENPWDMVYASSDAVDHPALMATRFISDSWTNEEKAELMNTLNKTTIGSAESLEAWDKLDALLAEECPDIIFCHGAGELYAYNADLNWNTNGGTWRYWWNVYWNNPADHQ